MILGRILSRKRPIHRPGLRSPGPTDALGFAQAGRLVASIGRFVIRAPGFTLLAFIGLYQRTLSPALPVFFGSACGCRFSPSCSHYAADAIRAHGAIAGVILAAIRLVKCSPLHPGGFDPVPPARHSRPRCTRLNTGVAESSSRLL